MTIDGSHLPSIIAGIALIISAWSARSSASQVAMAQRRAELDAAKAKIDEMQALYGARYAGLEERCKAFERDAIMFKLHAERCEEDLRRLSKHVGYSSEITP